MTRAARRQLDLAWHSGRLAVWVAQTRRLHYSGAYGTTLSRASTVELNAAAAFALQDHFDHWSACSLSSSVHGQASSVAEQLTGGDEIFDGLWLSPAALDALQDGQTLDTDPVTGPPSA